MTRQTGCALVALWWVMGCNSTSPAIDGDTRTTVEGGSATMDGGHATVDGGPLASDAGTTIDAARIDDGGTACGARGTCGEEGTCRCGSGEACGEGLVCCGGACVDTATDVEHCGGCEEACPSMARSTRSCAAASCGFTCDDGFADCHGGDDGCESDLRAPATCGRCNRACETGELCDSGACTRACGPGLTSCGGSCVDTSISLSHCGGCDSPCRSVPFASATCNNRVCMQQCEGARLDCNGDLNLASSDGCETDPPLLYPDADGDGYGDAEAAGQWACPGSVGYVANHRDCFDGDALVHPGAAESCNGVDDDCDGFADEALELDEPVVVGTYSTTAPATGVTFTWVTSRAQGALAWSARDALGDYGLYFSRIDETGARVRDRTVLWGMSAPLERIQVGWDGSAWAIFYALGGGRLRVVRLRDDGSTLNLAANVPRPLAGTGSISFVRLAQGAGELAILTSGAGSSLYGFVYREGAVVNEHVVLAISSGSVGTLTAFDGGGYAMVANDLRVLPGPPWVTVYRTLLQRFDSAGLVGPQVELLPETTAILQPMDVVADGDRIALVYRDLAALRMFYVVARASDGSALGGVRDLGPFGVAGHAAAAGDGSVGVVTGDSGFFSARARASDGALYPTSFAAPARSPALAFEAIRGRYAVVTSYSGNLFLTSYGCAVP